MRSALAVPITPLLGSLGLHCGFVLVLFIAVRRPMHSTQSDPARSDAWAGNAVEVDAVATSDTVSALPNESSTSPKAGAQDADEPTPAEATRASESKLPKQAADAALPPTPAPTHPTHSAKTAPKNLGSTSAPSPVEASGSSGSASPATGAFGAEGLPPGVRSLPSAFTRAIPPATGADPIWQTLPVGVEHPFTIAIEVDADGHISSAEILREKDGSVHETQAAHVRERVAALLGGGLFALQNNVGAGRVLFRITITLSDRPVHEDDDPAQLVERGFDPPRGSAPGRAYFTLASGRHFDAKVQVLATP